MFRVSYGIGDKPIRKPIGIGCITSKEMIEAAKYTVARLVESSRQEN